MSSFCIGFRAGFWGLDDLNGKKIENEQCISMVSVGLQICSFKYPRDIRVSKKKF
jgi:hypothetical protein